ncbi:uncharacterized protein MONBRDRAFT_20001 [Monosiga brevicollis MX1]|uniref:Aminoacyl-transfer RNA synthetases class-II family profile domain-containing protein n=1 Tax=Monosiga brevicollis TaxID=81824 RepID=A9UTK6_MONBE|nr:uncharacterized protein MONBRDRAFT_20001 [Monosiga brevicollis MX1]EDQ91510.1 predicted protein [Monosiga brevicollis MX1]|eukprot:XP_001743932.1 hypothetical protein [Monosiga brevicollis MX1]
MLARLLGLGRLRAALTPAPTGWRGLPARTGVRAGSTERGTGTYRTHMCGDLTKHVKQQVRVAGWVEAIRKAGDDLLFVTLRDATGRVQVKATGPDMHLLAKTSIESVFAIEGEVCVRPDSARRSTHHDQQSSLELTDLEICSKRAEELSRAASLPFRPASLHDQPLEDTRLRHRPLDLRRAVLQDALRLRHKLSTRFRAALNDNGFLEVETPTLFKRTPGGANEFLVPTQMPGKFYALVQSPQQYKQMLMVGGIDRYYQFARCYRDEGGRMDRQPEFTQLDLEMAFAGQAEVMELMEKVVKHVLQDWIDTARPFERLTFHEAMSQYGSDKPDRRFDMLLQDVTPELLNCGHVGWIATAFVLFFCYSAMRSCLLSQGRPALRAKHAQLDDQKDFAVIALRADQAQRIDALQQHARGMGMEVGVGLGMQQSIQEQLGKLRLYIAQILAEHDLLKLDDEQLDIFWVYDFPMFEQHELNSSRIQACHHPFTAPHPDDIAYLETEPMKVRAQHYDLVMNGVELGGGSVRIHDAELQRYIIDHVLQDDPKVFEQLLQALAYGAPPHAGIALGFDRLVLMLSRAAGARSLRDVMAFPKSFAGKELMSDSPSTVTAADLDVYHIQTKSLASD